MFAWVLGKYCSPHPPAPLPTNSVKVGSSGRSFSSEFAGRGELIVGEVRSFWVEQWIGVERSLTKTYLTDPFPVINSKTRSSPIRKHFHQTTPKFFFPKSLAIFLTITVRRLDKLGFLPISSMKQTNRRPRFPEADFDWRQLHFDYFAISIAMSSM